MTWDPDLRAQVLADQREAARLRGATSPDEREPVRLETRIEDAVNARRRVVRKGVLCKQ